jgi:hypothetical protein
MIPMPMSQIAIMLPGVIVIPTTVKDPHPHHPIILTVTTFINAVGVAVALHRAPSPKLITTTTIMQSHPLEETLPLVCQITSYLAIKR